MLNRFYLILTFIFLSLPVYAVDLTTYIINGSDTSLAEHDDFASLYYDDSAYGGALYQAYCGATLLNSQYVLTAAHCLFDVGTTPYKFALLFTKVGQTATANTSNVDGVRAQEFYYYSSFSNSSSDLWANDIAIIKLESALNTSGAVSRATNDSYRNDSSNSYVTIGLGLTSSTDSGNNRTLLSADMTYVDNGTCVADLGSYGSSLTDKQICFAGSDHDDNDATFDAGVCSGDSGGPIYLRDGSTYIQVGITSFGPEPCGTGDVTSIYTEVSDYDTWITNVLSGSVEPQFIATDALREAYTGETSTTNTSSSFTATTSGGSSGGSLGWLSVLMLSGLAFVRNRVYS